MKKIVVASNNPGKLREFSVMLTPLGFEVIPQIELGVKECPEPFSTFFENALAKARHATQQTGLPAIADDSGICVPTLAGAPGIHSARYAGNQKSDKLNNEKLVEALRNKKDRRAYYYCALVYMHRPDDQRPIITDGEWRGEIVLKPKGINGFGYDPYFYVQAFGCTAAEFSTTRKNRISHRGIALRALNNKLQYEME